MQTFAKNMGLTCLLVVKVTVTPASGFIIPASSLAFGFLGAIACRAAVQVKKLVSVDDALDVLAVHGVGGLVGTLLAGVFAQNSITQLDGISSIPGGLIDGPLNERWMQVVWQAAGCGATIGWSLFGTFAILFIMNKVPGLKLRVNSGAGQSGVDSLQMGEKAYDYDVVPTRGSVQHGAAAARRGSVSAALYHIKRMTVE